MRCATSSRNVFTREPVSAARDTFKQNKILLVIQLRFNEFKESANKTAGR